MPIQNEYILFVTSVPKQGVAAVAACNETLGKKYKIIVIRDKNKKEWNTIAKARGIHTLLTCDFSKPHAIEKALLPYKHHIKAATFYGDGNAVLFAKIVPHIPHLSLPSSESLVWSTDKIEMRQLFQAYDSTITPAFTVVKDIEEKTIERIIKRIGFPLVIKPAGLASSLLVTMCYHEDELRTSLKKVFKKIEKIYTENKRTTTPKLLVEQFMEGEMYSVDAYVNKQGKATYCPLVYVKTGKAVGFDDFFGYLRITPTKLKDTTIAKALDTAKKSLQALNLRSTTVHIELMRTEDGWKVIELGPRIGGFRNVMYELSHGIHHPKNDLLNRLEKQTVVPKKQLNYVGVLRFYGKKEGTIQKIEGIRKVKKLSSFQNIIIHQKPGDKSVFAKHGGKGVCNIVLANKKRPELLADIRRVEEMLKITIQK